MNPLNYSYPVKDYYGEAKRGPKKMMICPHCKRQGRIAKNGYELARRIAEIERTGVIICSVCQSILPLTHPDESRVWYCEYCDIVVCVKCQKKR